MAIAVQAAVGGPGSKATTELTNYDFNSMALINGQALGANDDGLYLLNTGTKDGTTSYTRSVTFASSDFGVHNPKRLRFVYIGINTDSKFTVTVSVDEQTARSYSVTPKKTGLQRLRVPIGRDGQGRYWKIKISSAYWFRIDSVEALPVVRSAGIVGY